MSGSLTTDRKSILVGLAAPLLKSDLADADEIEVYRRDPFAHLDATEEWVDDQGETWKGHVFIPQIGHDTYGAFIPMEHQIDFIEQWVNLQLLHDTGDLRFFNVLIEKARQMGMTWLLAYLVWWILSYHDVSGGYSNMNAAEVDDGGEASTSDSFFGKIRTIHERVPPRLQQPLYFRGGNAPLIRKRGGTGFILGRGAVMNPGRGGTYRYWIVDEAARFRHGEAAHASLDRAVPFGRVYNSTPYGEANVYYRIRDEKPRNWKLVAYHWNEHPLYGYGRHVSAVAPDAISGEAGHMSVQPDPEAEEFAAACEKCKATILGIPWNATDPISHRYSGKMVSPWYDDAVIGLTDDQVASELDIDYAGSLPARVYHEFDERVHVLDSIPYTPKIDISLAFDYGLDVTAVAILQDTPHEILQIGEVEVGDATPDEVSRAIVAEMRKIGVPERLLDPRWLERIFAVGDPSGDYREVGTGKSIASQYRDSHFHITSPGKPWPVAKTILTAKRILLGKPKIYRVAADTCPNTIRHWKLNRWPIDRDGNRKPGATAPLDDVHNHMLRGLSYWMTYKYPAPDILDELEEAKNLAMLRQRDGVFTTARYGEKF